MVSHRSVYASMALSVRAACPSSTRPLLYVCAGTLDSDTSFAQPLLITPRYCAASAFQAAHAPLPLPLPSPPAAAAAAVSLITRATSVPHVSDTHGDDTATPTASAAMSPSSDADVDVPSLVSPTDTHTDEPWLPPLLPTLASSTLVWSSWTPSTLYTPMSSRRSSSSSSSAKGEECGLACDSSDASSRFPPVLVLHLDRSVRDPIRVTPSFPADLAAHNVTLSPLTHMVTPSYHSPARRFQKAIQDLD